jgi:hypothetical protein
MLLLGMIRVQQKLVKFPKQAAKLQFVDVPARIVLPLNYRPLHVIEGDDLRNQTFAVLPNIKVIFPCQVFDESPSRLPLSV